MTLGKITRSVVLLAMSAPPLLAQEPKRVDWDFASIPITIEVTRDVPIRRCGSERGVLCAEPETVIPRGDRFRMLEIGIEGGCTIEYEGTRYEPSSCPWVLGFRDHEADLFVIVEVARSEE